MLTLLLALPLSGAWVSGPEYLAYSDLSANEPVVIQQKVSSEAFIEEGCRLWVRDESSGNLSSYSPKRRLELPDPTGEILSDGLDGEFVTRTLDGTAIERRGNDGKVLETIAAPWAQAVVRIVGGPEGQRWALLNRTKSLTLLSLDKHFQTLKETPIAQSQDFWGTPKLVVDSTARTLWVGYSATRPGLSYAPHIARVGFDGKIEKVVQWSEKGLFFDACLDEEFSLLASRDKPSSAYTVPVYSYLESISATGEVAVRYEAETNWFIDALVCQPDRLWMVQRSIFGSEGSYLVSWDRIKGSPAKRLHRLPAPARKLYACSGFSEGISVE